MIPAARHGQSPTDGPSLTIAATRRRDVHAIRKIDEAVYPKAWSLELWRRELQMSIRERRYLAAFDGAVLVGHAGMMVLDGDGHIATVAVDPRRQGEGIASHLMIELMHDARRRQLGGVTLEVRVSNERAQALYERFGFSPSGVRPGYYGDDPGERIAEDAVVMWASDVGEPAWLERLAAIEAALPGGRHVEPTAVTLARPPGFRRR